MAVQIGHGLPLRRDDEDLRVINDPVSRPRAAVVPVRHIEEEVVELHATHAVREARHQVIL